MNKMVRVDIRIPEEVFDEVERVAEREALPRSVLLRSLIMKGLKTEGADEESQP